MTGGGVLAIGQFATIEEASRAAIVPWESILKDVARDGLIAYLKAASKPKVSKRKRTISISPCNGRTQRPPLATIGSRNISSCPDGTKLNYVLGGRAGSIIIPSNGLILSKKLRENLLSSSTDDEHSWSSKNYSHQSYGSSQYWTPAGVVGVTKTELTQLKERAQTTKRIIKLFGGKKSKISTRFQRTLSLFSLHNM